MRNGKVRMKRWTSTLLLWTAGMCARCSGGHSRGGDAARRAASAPLRLGPPQGGLPPSATVCQKPANTCHRLPSSATTCQFWVGLRESGWGDYSPGSRRCARLSIDVGPVVPGRAGRRTVRRRSWSGVCRIVVHERLWEETKRTETNCCRPTITARATHAWGMIPSAAACPIGGPGIGRDQWREGLQGLWGTVTVCHIALVAECEGR